MRVAFDQKIFLLQQYGGISRILLLPSFPAEWCCRVEVKNHRPYTLNKYLGAQPECWLWSLRSRIPRPGDLIEPPSRLLAGPIAAFYKPHIFHETLLYNA